MRSGDFYFNTQFEKIEKTTFRSETPKSKILKLTLKEVLELKDYVKNDDFSFDIFKEKLDTINFGLWDFNFFNWFFSSQNELLKSQKTGKFGDGLIKNLLLNNLTSMERRLETEIVNLEVWKIV